MPRKAQESPKLPKVSVLERRLKHPFGAPEVPITLKEGGPWAIRWANDGVRTGRVYQIIQMGWTFVRPEEIDGKPTEYGCKVQDGRLVRGDHGEEVLVKMPLADFNLIQQAKSDKNIASLGGKRALQDSAEAVAKRFGDEAAETVYRSEMTVTDSRVAMDLEGEGPG